MIRSLDVITDSMDMSLRILWEILKDREALNSAVYGVAKSQTLLINLKRNICSGCFKQPWKGWERMEEEGRRERNEKTGGRTMFIDQY